MINNMVKQQVLASLTRFKSYQEAVGEDGKHATKDVIINEQLNLKNDIYGQDKAKLKSSETSRYFTCDNCGRKIAGGRFAQHMTKCLERKRR